MNYTNRFLVAYVVIFIKINGIKHKKKLY